MVHPEAPPPPQVSAPTPSIRPPPLPPYMGQAAYPAMHSDLPPPPGLEPVTLPSHDQPPPPGTDYDVPVPQRVAEVQGEEEDYSDSRYCYMYWRAWNYRKEFTVFWLFCNKIQEKHRKNYSKIQGQLKLYLSVYFLSRNSKYKLRKFGVIWPLLFVYFSLTSHIISETVFLWV